MLVITDETQDRSKLWLSWIWSRLTGNSTPPADANTSYDHSSYQRAYELLSSANSWSDLKSAREDKQNTPAFDTLAKALLYAIQQFTLGKFHPQNVGKGFPTLTETLQLWHANQAPADTL